MESFGDFSLSLVALAALIPGIVQTVKELLGWEGTKARALTLFTGMFFGGLFYAVDQALIPEAYHAWIKLAIFTLASGPAAITTAANPARAGSSRARLSRPDGPTSLHTTPSTRSRCIGGFCGCSRAPVSAAGLTIQDRMMSRNICWLRPYPSASTSTITSYRRLSS